MMVVWINEYPTYLFCELYFNALVFWLALGLVGNTCTFTSPLFL